MSVVVRISRYFFKMFTVLIVIWLSSFFVPFFSFFLSYFLFRFFTYYFRSHRLILSQISPSFFFVRFLLSSVFCFDIEFIFLFSYIVSVFWVSVSFSHFQFVSSLIYCQIEAFNMFSYSFFNF